MSSTAVLTVTGSPVAAAAAAQHSTPAPSGGRHRAGRSAGPAAVSCRDLPAVAARLEAHRTRPGVRTASRRGAAFLRWLVDGAPAGRHTWGFLAGSGGRPRTAFAIILSL